MEQLNNTESNRSEDMSQEKIISKYIYDIYFKNYLDKKNKLTSDFITNREMQLAGIDIQCYKNPFVVCNIDLKAQTDYINSPTPSFVLELSSFQHGKEIPGWYLDKKSRTNCYGFVWIWGALKDREINYEDIKVTELMLISKAKIKRVLNENGITDEYLNRIISYMRNNNVKVIDKNTRIEDGIDIPDSKIKKYISIQKVTRKVECAIIIVIKKALLLELCDSVYMYFHDRNLYLENTYASEDWQTKKRTLYKLKR